MVCDPRRRAHRVRSRRSSVLYAAIIVSHIACGGYRSAVPAPLSGVERGVVACADRVTVQGIDVSHYQGTIDWKAVHASGRAFAITAIGDGTWEDFTFDTNWNAIRAEGMIRGAYQ